MKVFISSVLFICVICFATAQTDPNSLVKIHNLSDPDFTTLNTTAPSGTLGYRASNGKFYYNNGTQWVGLLVDNVTYVAINEFLRSEPVFIPSASGSFNGNITFVVPPDYDGYTVESVIYRVVKTGSSNIEVGLSKINPSGVITDLSLDANVGSVATATANGGVITVNTGDALYMTLSGTTPTTQPEGLMCTIKLVKP